MRAIRTACVCTAGDVQFTGCTSGASADGDTLRLCGRRRLRTVLRGGGALRRAQRLHLLQRVVERGPDAFDPLRRALQGGKRGNGVMSGHLTTPFFTPGRRP